MPLCDAGEHEALRRAVEIPTEARLWGVGEALSFVPRLTGTVFGVDGMVCAWASIGHPVMPSPGHVAREVEGTSR